MSQLQMTQLQKIKSIFNKTHENEYEKWEDEDLLHVLVNIAESLAIIADSLKKEKK